MPKINVLHGIFLLLSIFLAFIFLNNPFESTKEVAQLSLFFVVSSVFLFLIFLTTPKLKDIEIESPKEFFDEYVTGLFLGVIVAYSASTLAWGIDKVINFTGSISAASIATMSDTTILFIVHVLPLVETLILVGITLVIGSFLSKKIPFSYLIAGVIASLVFAAFHFTAVGGGNFEYSVNGFVDFVSSPEGALVHFSFGLLSVIVFLGFRSFVILYSLHHLNNLLSMSFSLGWTPLLTGLLALDVGIVAIVILKMKLVKWKSFDVGRVFA